MSTRKRIYIENVLNIYTQRTVENENIVLFCEMRSVGIKHVFEFSVLSF